MPVNHADLISWPTSQRQVFKHMIVQRYRRSGFWSRRNARFERVPRRFRVKKGKFIFLQVNEVVSPAEQRGFRLRHIACSANIAKAMRKIRIECFRGLL